MVNFLRYLVMLVVLATSFSGMAFYDSNSWCNYKILSDSDEDGYTVELTSSDLLDVSVPSTVTYGAKTYTVVGIGNEAFKNKTLNIDKLSLPNTLRYIGSQAFYNTKFQTPNKTKTYSFPLPSNITAIGDEAFMNAYAHNDGRITIALPSALSVIPYRCFFQADFQSVDINKACKSIKSTAFSSFKGSIYVPSDNQISVIEGSPFYNSNLTTISLPQIESLATSSFSNCANLTTISIGERISVIPANLLNNCTKLTDATFKGEITQIGENAFKNCAKLKMLTIGSSVESIGDYAFDGCSELTSFDLPSTLKSIGSCSFRGCKNFKYLYFPDDMETIGSGAFSQIEVTRVLLNSSIQSIGAKAFNFVSGAELLLKFKAPSDILTPLLSMLQNGMNIYIPNWCLNNFEYVEGWRILQLADKDIEYKTLPTWSLSNYTSVYGESVDPKLFYYSDTYLTGDDEIGDPIILSDYSDWKDVGDYPVNLSWNNTPHSKFIFLLDKDWHISKATLISRASDASRMYGEPNPEIEVEYSGFKYEENKSVIEKTPTVTIDADQESNVGEYPITLSGGEAQNYSFMYVPATLTIEKATQFITWDQEFRNIYEGQEIELDAVASSGLEVTYETDSSSLIKIEGNIVKVKAQGQFSIKAIQKGNDNYLPATPVERVITAREYIIDKLFLDESEINIKAGDSFQLTASWEPSDIESPELLWTSTAPCAIVNESGLVTGISQGKATIRVALKEKPEVNASCTVNIGILTGLIGVESSTDFPYIIEHNKLIVTSDSSAPIRIFSIEGAVLYQGMDKEILLDDGFYILFIDGRAIKIKI